MRPPPSLSVLQVVTTDQRRGAETFAAQLGQALAPRVAHVRTVALAPGTGPSLGIEVLGRSRRDVRGLRHLRRLVRDADVVVAHGSATLWAAAAATAGTGTPFVYRLIGDPTFWSGRLDRRLRVAAVMRRAAAVATYFPAAATALTAHLHLAPGSARVIPKGIDLAAHPVVSDDERVAARAALDVTGDGPVLAWIGALGPEKRPALAFEVADRVPDSTLLVAGDGPLRSTLEPLAGPRRRLLGAVADPRPALAACDVVLITSVTEGVPGVALEAAAAGVPVVAVDVGGLDRVVLDGRSGRLVDGAGADGSLAARLADAVTTTLPVRDDMGRRARALVEAGSDLDVVAERWLELLTEVTGGRSTSRAGRDRT